ncbi:tripartite tricarboxylate transporter substrate binding protein [Actinophytocola sediminis]
MRKKTVTAALASVALLAPTACSTAEGGSDAKTGEPDRVEVVCHTKAGGGSDEFIRGVLKIMYDEQVISANWPVRNVPAGDGIGAMSYLVAQEGQDNEIATMTPTWIVTPMTVADSDVSIDGLTPIVGLVNEPTVVAVRADAPYESLSDFVDAAKEDPSTLIQTGGSTTASDSLTGLALQKSTEAKWKFLSFEETGSRLTALLRGDADMMLGSPGDFSEQVRAGKLKVITVLTDDKLPEFPDAPTAKDVGISTGDLPLQFRGILGAPGVSKEAIAYYEKVFKKMLDTEAWKEHAAEEGLVTDYRNSKDFGEYLTQQREVLGGLLEDLGLRKDQ